MPTVRLNDKAKAHAADLIAAGTIDRDSSWSGIADDDAAAILGPKGNDWGSYSKWHLGLLTGAERNSRAAWRYPIGNGNILHRSSLVAARQAAAQENHTSVFQAAGDLLELIDGEHKYTRDDLLSALASINVSAHAVQLKPLDWGEMEEKVIQLAPWGNVIGLDGRSFKVTERSSAEIPRRFAERQNPVAVDYDHQSLFPMGGPFAGIASGWIWNVWVVEPGEDPQAIANRWGEDAARIAGEWGPGVYGLARWTERALEAINAREYGFISPVTGIDYDTMELLEIRGAGLTNNPNLDGMMPVAAQRQQEVNGPAGVADPVPTEEHRQKEHSAMDEKVKETLSKLLGRPVTDDASLIAAVEDMHSATRKNEDRLTALEEAHRLDRAEGIVDLAIMQGRIPKDKREQSINHAKQNPEAFKLTLELLPVNTVEKPPSGGRITPPPADGSHEEVGSGNVTFFLNANEAHRVKPERVRELDEAISLAHRSYNGDIGRAIRARAAKARV